MGGFRPKRDWNQSTIGKAHDTRDLTRRGGGHGNAGSLTFSISVALGKQFLTRFCNGQEYAHVKLEVLGNDIHILPAKADEPGRKFSLSTYGNDYRAFFDGGNYPWIKPIKAFGATPTPTKLSERGIIITMPPENKRNSIDPYVQYKPRLRHAYPPNPPAIANLPAVTLPMTEVMPPASGTLYLVMVPRDTDEQFHTLLRFLKLEALRE